jgi:hypothetical protein
MGVNDRSAALPAGRFYVVDYNRSQVMVIDEMESVAIDWDWYSFFLA